MKYRSQAEKYLMRRIRRLGIPLAYVGNAKDRKNAYWITLATKAHANPDFINESRRKIVEVFGAMGTFHTEAEVEKRVSDFAAVGWECLVVTDFDLFNHGDDVLLKIKAFCEAPNPLLNRTESLFRNAAVAKSDAG